MHFWTLCVPCMTGAPSLSLVCFRGHTLECMLHNESLKLAPNVLAATARDGASPTMGAGPSIAGDARVSHQSFGQRMCSSICGMFVGVILFIVGAPHLTVRLGSA